MSPKIEFAEDTRPAGKISGQNCGATGKESVKLKEQTTIICRRLRQTSWGNGWKPASIIDDKIHCIADCEVIGNCCRWLIYTGMVCRRAFDDSFLLIAEVKAHRQLLPKSQQLLNQMWWSKRLMQRLTRVASGFVIRLLRSIVFCSC